MTKHPGPADLALDFIRLNESLRAGGARESAMQRLVDLAVTTIPGCDWSAITAWPSGRQPRSLAHSSPIAQRADQLQYDSGDGPCLSAAADEGSAHIHDLDTEPRWPQFRAAAKATTPVRSVLSFHLENEPHPCALNLYGSRPGAGDTGATEIAALFAAHARVLLLHAASNDRASQLTQALTTSRQIGAAVGILMNVYKITSDQAFDLLRTTSQRLNRKLHTVADDVTQTGRLPR